MAIYSLNHKSVGKGTQKRAGTAGANARYILRPDAAQKLGENMPTGRFAAQHWMDAQEAGDRKNGRVADKVLVALPLELTPEERAELVEDFMDRVGNGRVSWVAGIHSQGEDEANPHAHILIRDKDFQTGKRVAMLSEKGSTDRLRELWETATNEALERAGLDIRVDRRSLAEQGIEREAGIHVGPGAAAMDERGERPASQERVVHLVTGETRVIDYPTIDQGQTRPEHQREIEDGNRLKMAVEAHRRPLDALELSEVEIQRPEPEAIQRASIAADEPISFVVPSASVVDRAAGPTKEIAPRPSPTMFAELYGRAAEMTRRVVDRARALFERQQQGPERLRPEPEIPPPLLPKLTPAEKQLANIKAIQERRLARQTEEPEQLRAQLERARQIEQTRDGPG